MSAKALGAGFEKPIVIDGHLSDATGPWEMVMAFGSTLSTLPSARCEALAAAGAEADPNAAAAGAAAVAAEAMLPNTERSRASESMRN